MGKRKGGAAGGAGGGQPSKKAKFETLEDALARPWCYYCNRDFDNLVPLRFHQKSKHFQCREAGCHRRLDTAGGLAVHMRQVHKAELKKIENALEGRENPTLEIFGEEGVPADIYQQRVDKIKRLFSDRDAEYRARTGNPHPGSVPKGQSTQNKPKADDSVKIETPEEMLARSKLFIQQKKAEVAAKIAARKAGVPEPTESKTSASVTSASGADHDANMSGMSAAGPTYGAAAIHYTQPPSTHAQAYSPVGGPGYSQPPISQASFGLNPAATSYSHPMNAQSPHGMDPAGRGYGPPGFAQPPPHYNVAGHGPPMPGQPAPYFNGYGPPVATPSPFGFNGAPAGYGQPPMSAYGPPSVPQPMPGYNSTGPYGHPAGPGFQDPAQMYGNGFAGGHPLQPVPSFGPPVHFQSHHHGQAYQSPPVRAGSSPPAKYSSYPPPSNNTASIPMRPSIPGLPPRPVNAMAPNTSYGGRPDGSPVAQSNKAMMASPPSHAATNARPANNAQASDPDLEAMINQAQQVASSEEYRAAREAEEKSKTEPNGNVTATEIVHDLAALSKKSEHIASEIDTSVPALNAEAVEPMAAKEPNQQLVENGDLAQKVAERMGQSQSLVEAEKSARSNPKLVVTPVNTVTEPTQLGKPRLTFQQKLVTGITQDPPQVMLLEADEVSFEEVRAAERKYDRAIAN